MKKETLQQAENWFKMNNIPTTLCLTTLCIEVEGFLIEISDKEVNYRASLWNDYINENKPLKQ